MEYHTFFLFATAIAIGSAGFLPLVPCAKIGRRFFILMSLISVVFIALGLVFQGLETGYLFVASSALLIAFNISLPAQTDVDPSGSAIDDGDEKKTSGRGLALFAWAALAGAVGCGFVGIVLDAVDISERSGDDALTPTLVALNFVSSSLLLGASLVTMVLGHWYLVARKLSFAPLRRMTIALGVSLLARLVLSSCGIWAQADRWSELATQSGWAGLFMSDGVFVVTRFVLGLILPLVMAGLVWGCLRIESNQSATGILYVMVVFVVIGELLSKQFLLNAHLLF